MLYFLDKKLATTSLIKRKSPGAGDVVLSIVVQSMKAAKIHKSIKTATQDIRGSQQHSLCAHFLIHFHTGLPHDLPNIQKTQAEQFQTDQRDQVS